MSEKKCVVLIPFWVQETLKRNGLQLSACLDLDTIRPFVSTNDLACFLTLQDNMYVDSIIGAKSFSTLGMIWSENINKTNTDLASYRSVTLTPLVGDKSIKDELNHRLFDLNTSAVNYKEPFAIYDLTPDVIGIVIYPGYFKPSNNVTLQKEINEGIIEVLYRYNSFHEVAKTPFFRRYLELLK